MRIDVHRKPLGTSKLEISCVFFRFSQFVLRTRTREPSSGRKLNKTHVHRWMAIALLDAATDREVARELYDERF